MIDLTTVSTETYNQNSRHIELQSTCEILRRINQEDRIVANAIRGQIPQIGRLIDAIENHTTKKTRIIHVGSGTSGRLGLLDATECLPTYGVEHDVVMGIIAGGQDAMVSAPEDVEDSRETAGKI